MISLRADKRKDQKTVRNALIVVGAFILFLLLFGGIMLWWFFGVYLPQNRSQQAPSVVSESVFTKEDAFSSLVILHDTQVRCFLLVGCDPTACSIKIRGISADSETDFGTLDQCFVSKGYQTAQKEVEKMLDREIRYALSVSIDTLPLILDDAGGSLEYTFADDFCYTNRLGIEVRYLAGKRYSLSSNAVCDLLLYQDADAANQARALRAAQLFTELVNQKMTETVSLEKKFQKWIGYAETQVRISDFVKVQPILQFLANQNKGTLATVEP